MKYAFLALATSSLFVVIVGCGSKANGPDLAAVQTILDKNCVGCHGIDKPKGGVTLTGFDGIMAQGSNGPIVKSRDVEGSVLAQVLRAKGGKPQMPPGGPLPEADIATIEKWIEIGAAR